MKGAIIVSLLFIIVCVASASQVDLNARLIRGGSADAVARKKGSKGKGGKGGKGGSTKPQAKADDYFDYFVLAISWSGTACKVIN